MRIVVGMTGASGAILGIKVLELLNKLNHEVFLVLSDWGEKNIRIETSYEISKVKSLATNVFTNQDLDAPIASGSFLFDAMVVVPCSMKTLSAIANGYAADLITRAADVTIKEQRKLVLVTRETPLSPIHLNNMLRLSQIGVLIMPPVPAFYSKATTMDQFIGGMAGRIIEKMGIDNQYVQRWS